MLNQEQTVSIFIIYKYDIKIVQINCYSFFKKRRLKNLFIYNIISIHVMHIYVIINLNNYIVCQRSII